jgi:hypothetical protein
VDLPVASSASLVGRVSWWGASGYSELLTVSPGPHLLFMVLCDGGPPVDYGLDVLDQDARSGPTPGRWAKYGGDQTNILS